MNHRQFQQNQSYAAWCFFFYPPQHDVDCCRSFTALKGVFVLCGWGVLWWSARFVYHKSLDRGSHGHIKSSWMHVFSSETFLGWCGNWKFLDPQSISKYTVSQVNICLPWTREFWFMISKRTQFGDNLQLFRQPARLSKSGHRCCQFICLMRFYSIAKGKWPIGRYLW